MNDPRDYRTRIYERYATGFQSASLRFDTAAAERWGRLYRHYLKPWMPGSKDAPILDAACGGGKLLYLLSQLGYKNLTGIDRSAEQVQLARQTIPSVEEGDVIGFLEKHPKRYRLVFALDLLEHLRKDEALRFLDACSYALDFGGRLVVQTPNADSPFGGAIRYGDFTHETGFNANSLSGLLALTGFSDVKARELAPIPFGYSFNSTIRSALWQVLHAGIALWNTVETGHPGSGIFTRVFMVTGIKR